VVITGTGVICPLGKTVEALWSALQEGRSGVGPITLFDASKFPTRIAAEVKDFHPGQYVDDASPFRYSGRNTQFAVGASVQAVADSGLMDSDPDPSRVGVYLGSGEGQHDFLNFVNLIRDAWTGDEVLTGQFTGRGVNLLHPLLELEQEPNMTAAHLARLFNAQGPNANCLTACAASSQAIGEAVEIIRRGDADAVISGGAHSMIHPFGVTGFNLLTALSVRNDDPTRASRPFDRQRDGFILGEGAAIIVLEELEHARRRSAPIYGEIAGYGSTGDAFRITDTHPEGRGAVACMKLALADAGLEPEQIDYVNAHGTSTIVNDKIETMAIKEVFGRYAQQVPVSSVKSMLGHLIAAAGGLEVIICTKTIADGVIPPTTNYEEPDPECDLDYVPNEARQATVNTTLSNSFGFGGQNISLVVRRFTG